MTLPPSDPLTVLIVDDIPTNLDLLRDVLEPEGFRILAATSGHAALKILQRTLPDLILLDVAMPEVDGFETCRQLKLIDDVKAIPVIFVTARHEAESIARGFASGAADYLTKPFNRHEVVIRVKAHVENSRLQRLVHQRNLELERLNLELRQRHQELEEALANIKTLRGLIPICSYCKKVRDDKGYWEQVELYVKRHSDASFTHGICPECTRQHFPAFAKHMTDSHL